MAGDIDRGAVAEEGEGDPRRITGHARGVIYPPDWSQPVRRRARGTDSSAITNLSEVDATDWFPRLPQSGKAAAHAKLGKAPPSRWEVSLYITTPTLVQLNAAQEKKIRSGKPKKASDGHRRTLHRQRTDGARSSSESKGSPGKKVSVKRRGIYKIGRNDKTFRPNNSLPREEAPLVAPSIAAGFLTVLSAVVTVVTTSLSAVVTGLSVVPAGLSAVPAVLAVIATTTDGELDVRLDVKKSLQRR